MECRGEEGVVFMGVAFRELPGGRSQLRLPQSRDRGLQGSTHCGYCVHGSHLLPIDHDHRNASTPATRCAMGVMLAPTKHRVKRIMGRTRSSTGSTQPWHRDQSPPAANPTRDLGNRETPGRYAGRERVPLPVRALRRRVSSSGDGQTLRARDCRGPIPAQASRLTPAGLSNAKGRNSMVGIRRFQSVVATFV